MFGSFITAREVLMTAPTPSTDAASAAAYTPGSDVRGRFLWYDLLTPDVEAAVAFYTSVTGWTRGSFDFGGGQAYTMWLAGETPVGGSMPLPPEEVARGTKAHWLAYIGTPDVDAAHARALELGAQTRVAPMDVPTVGRTAVLVDPQGALFALYAPSNAGAPEAMPKLGEFSWHELHTTDHVAALDFYAELFGWHKTDAMDMGPMGVYQMFGRGAFTYGGMFAPPAEMLESPHWLIYVTVADLEAAIERVRAGGGEILNGPMDVPGGDRIAQCRDPQGAEFALHHKGGA
jgi:predicted enzyme related to lactoylglutathione lyase